MNLADSGSIDDSASTVDLGVGSVGESPRSRLETIDNYRIDDLLGHGGMGEVYLATEQGLNRQVALKVLQAAKRISAIQVQRFLLEARAAAQLSHDHIVPIYHVGESKGIHYFTMRFIEGHDLSEIIRSAQRAMEEMSQASVDTQSPSDPKTKSRTGKHDSTVKDQADSTNSRIDLSASSFINSMRSGGARSAHKLALSVALIGKAVADALQHAHEHGIVHRDIKPSNLMLDQANKVWVTDFGLAQLQDSPELTNTGDLLGTLRYMSPEQATGQKAFIDRRTDIYSLGVTLYELATLQKACRGNSAHDILRSITFERPQPIRKINPKLPRDLETIICKATERNPSDRYQTAAELAADLQRFANNESLMARRPTRFKLLRNWIWDRPAISAMALAMLIVFAGSMMMIARANHLIAAASQQETINAKKALSTREAQQLQSMALVLKDRDPGLAIAAAIAGSEVVRGPLADRALRDSLEANHELRTLLTKFDFPGPCVVSESGDKILLCKQSAALGKTKQDAQVWSLKQKALAGPLKFDGVITAGAFINNDRYLLTQAISADEKDPTKSKQATDSIQLWDANTLTLIKSFRGADGVRISSSNYCDANRQLAIPGADRTSVIYDLASLNQSMVLPVTHEQAVLESLFSRDGTKLATLAQDNVVIVWEAATGKEIRRFKYLSNSSSATRIHFTADSKQLCITGDSGSYFISAVDNSPSQFKRRETITDVSEQNALAVLVSPSRRSAILYNIEPGIVVTQFVIDGLISSARLVAEDRYVAFVVDEAIELFDARSGKRVSQLLGHRDRITSIECVGTAPELVSVSWDGTLRHWHALSDAARRTLSVSIETSSPTLASLSPDGARLAIGSVRIDRSELHSIAPGNTAPIQFQGDTLLSLADGRVFSCVRDGVALWDWQTQRRTNFAALPDYGKSFIAQAIELPKVGKIALLTHDGELLVWILATNQLQRINSRDTERVDSIILDPTGDKLLASLSNSELVELNVEDFTRKRLMTLPSAAIELDMDPDREWLLVTGNNNAAFIVDLRTNKQVTTFTANGTVIKSARFISGDRVLTHGGIAAKAVVLWNAAEGKEIEAFPAQSVLALDVDAERTAAAIAAQSGATYWNFETNEKILIEDSPCEYVLLLKDKAIVATGGRQLPKSGEKIDPAPAQLLTWERNTQKVIDARPSEPHVLRMIAIPGAERYLVSSMSYGTEVIDVDKAQVTSSSSGHDRPLVFTDFGPDALSTISVSQDGKIIEHLISAGSDTTIGVHDRQVITAAISKDRRLLLTADDAGIIRYWDLHAKKFVRELSTNGMTIGQLEIGHDNSFAVAVLNDATVKYWDLRTGNEADISFEEGVLEVALSPDGQNVAVVTGKSIAFPGPSDFDLKTAGASEVRAVKLFSVSDRVPKTVPLAAAALACQFLESGKKLAILDSVGKVQVLDTASLKLSYEVQASRRIMRLLELPGDPSVLATASKNQVCLWRIQDGALLQEIKMPMSWSAVATSLPKKLLRGGRDSFYLLPSDKKIHWHPTDAFEYAEKIAPRRLTQQEHSMLLNTSAGF